MRHVLQLTQITTLSRLRHPCILEVVEPLEETRNEITFATEHVGTSLAGSLTARFNSEYQLDEVEIRKGLLQVCVKLTQIARSLQFLHESKRIHTNLTTNAVVINAKGDWKLAGVGYLTQLDQESDRNTHWALEEEEEVLPMYMQRDMDYVDPMYALDRKVSTANDMYSFGVLIFAIFHQGSTPYQTNGSINVLRSYSDRLPDRVHSPSWNELGPDVQGEFDAYPAILSNLISRMGAQRYSAKTFQSLPYFNSILVSVLKFMERDSFMARSRQEKIQFLRGLHKMLPQFSPALQRRKLLPSVRLSSFLPR